MAIEVFPSLLACDFAHLQADMERVVGVVDGWHVDVMDGHFVPNLSFGAPVFRCLDTELPLHVHLMVTNPEAYVEEYASVGVHTFIFHIEAVEDPVALCQRIQDTAMEVGVAINPATPVEALDTILSFVDEVLVMSVVPGFGGQSFMPEVLEKVTYIKQHAPQVRCAMDGGINADTIAAVRAAGVDRVIAGSYIFGSGDPVGAVALLRG